MFILFLENIGMKNVSELIRKLSLYDVKKFVKKKVIVTIVPIGLVPSFVLEKIEVAMATPLPYQPVPPY